MNRAKRYQQDVPRLVALRRLVELRHKRGLRTSIEELRARLRGLSPKRAKWILENL